MNREQQLEDALAHIAKVARNSRTKTKRLAFIEQRAVEALKGIEYNRDDFDLPKMVDKSPSEYQLEIKQLKKKIKSLLDQSTILDYSTAMEMLDSPPKPNESLFEILELDK